VSRIPSAILFIQKLVACHGLQSIFFLHCSVIKSQEKLFCTAIFYVVSGTFITGKSKCKDKRGRKIKEKNGSEILLRFTYAFGLQEKSGLYLNKKRNAAEMLPRSYS